MPGRLISGGGAILRLCSPQYICSSSILLQYMSSSYLLYGTRYIQCIGDNWLLIEVSHFALVEYSSVYQQVFFSSDLISMCQRCSSSLCLFSTAFCFCFFSLFSCSFLTRLLGLISTGSSGFTFF